MPDIGTIILLINEKQLKMKRKLMRGILFAHLFFLFGFTVSRQQTEQKEKMRMDTINPAAVPPALEPMPPVPVQSLPGTNPNELNKAKSVNPALRPPADTTGRGVERFQKKDSLK